MPFSADPQGVAPIGILPHGVAVGMVHGRFQPFHLGHLEYLLLAATRCRRLYLGITNPDPSHVRDDPADPQRSRPEANPFTYDMRYRMVADAAADAGVSRSRLVIVPLPIHEPRLWPSYVPEDAVCFLRIFSAWGEAKRQRLEDAGYRVEVLRAPDGKLISGSQVRQRLREGGDWRALVPAATARVVGPVL